MEQEWSCLDAERAKVGPMADGEEQDSRKLDLGPTALEVAKNVQRYRLDRGWSVGFLAAQVSVGLPISRMSVARIETGSRRVTTDELVAFSIALGGNALGASATADRNW